MGRIVWLASYPKSGNTWMRAFLHHLFRNPSRPLPLNALGGGGLTTSESKPDLYAALDSRPLADIPREERDRLRLRVHAAIAGSVPGNIFCKTHASVLMLRNCETIDMSVSAGAICMVRNPLDVAISFADFQGIGIDAAISAMGTRNFELRDAAGIDHPLGSWSQNVESWTGRPNPALHAVRYEDMLADARKAFGAVARFLGLAATPSRIGKAVTFSSFRELRRQEDRTGFNERSPAQERFFRSGTAGGWRATLTDDQVARIVGDHREQMTRFGYVPDGC
ncbi:MAG: sulfotransferase domain-containing protein [Rhodospirillales bacterium]|nr:sulfotransferase domain-containing protein [Rhodospirillales bacterium]